VKDHPGGIDHGTQAGLLQPLGLSADRFHHLIKGGARLALGDREAESAKKLAHKVHYQRMRISLR
jgi:hypothetical protein